jgi:hypothetical protein
MPIIGGVNLGNLTDYLFLFADGSDLAAWSGPSNGYIGNVAVTSSANQIHGISFAYAGNIQSDAALSTEWQQIITDNIEQATFTPVPTATISALQSNLVSAFQQINARPTNTSELPSPYNVNFTGDINQLDGLNTQNGVKEVFVLNITSGFSLTSQINITGDTEDVFILRWDLDGDPTNGYQGLVSISAGGAIVPHGGLTPTNFINVAGLITAFDGGSNPPWPYPQGPRTNNGTGDLITGGSNWNGGGFFTGYWLTTGEPTTEIAPGVFIGPNNYGMSAIFVGGWYTYTTIFDLDKYSAGVYVSPNPESIDTPALDITVLKEVSPDNGVTWYPADTSPGPNVVYPTNPQFRFTVTNTGNVTLTNVIVTDNVYGLIGTIPQLDPWLSYEWIIERPWLDGQQMNTVEATGYYQDQTVTAFNSAYWVGALVPAAPAINIRKEVSPDNGFTWWYPADEPPGPNVFFPTNPWFRFMVTNTGNVDLNFVTITDDEYGQIDYLPKLNSGSSYGWIIEGQWLDGQQMNTATATGDYLGQPVTASDSAYWVGVLVPAPAIDIKKDVSPDNGVTWYPADDPPGPNVVAPTDPQFRFTVTNTGNVDLTNIEVNDDVYGQIGTETILAPEASATWTITQPWLPGKQVNIATATGKYQGQTVTAFNPAHWVGVKTFIIIHKFVSADKRCNMDKCK